MKARIFTKFETYVNKIGLDNQIFYRKDPCTHTHVRAVNARARQNIWGPEEILSQNKMLVKNKICTNLRSDKNLGSKNDFGSKENFESKRIFWFKNKRNWVQQIFV